MLFNRLEPVLWTEEFASGNGLVQQTGENTACLLTEDPLDIRRHQLTSVRQWPYFDRAPSRGRRFLGPRQRRFEIIGGNDPEPGDLFFRLGKRTVVNHQRTSVGRNDTGSFGG